MYENNSLTKQSILILLLIVISLNAVSCKKTQNNSDSTTSTESAAGDSTSSAGDSANTSDDGSGSTSSSSATTETVSVTNAEDSLTVEETLQLTSEVVDSGGQVVTQTVTYSATNSDVATVSNEGLVTAIYPGQIEVTASADGITSDPFTLTVNAIPNTYTEIQITNNAVDDSWGMNNTWKTIARGQVFWLGRDDFDASGAGMGGSAATLFISDEDGNILFQRSVVGLEIDFLAMGSGAGTDDIMATWREDLANTFITDGDGGTVVDNGNNNAEENSIADGCMYYRDSTDQFDEDIANFQFPNSNVIESEVGGMDHDPITSECEAIWVMDGDLVFYDGVTQTTVATSGFILPSEYDFRSGQIVYEKDGDIYHVDTTTTPFTSTQITSDGASVVDENPKTDGKSIVWIQDDSTVVLYDIATQTSEVISTTLDVKDGETLAIDGRQVIWQESSDTFFFHDGSGDTSGTQEIVPTLASSVSEPFFSDGIVAWYGQTGAGTDTEIFMMK
jgi:hypothetical protein